MAGKYPVGIVAYAPERIDSIGDINYCKLFDFDTRQE